MAGIIKEGEMNQSEQINDLAKALAIVQGKLEHAKKDSTNPHFKSKYADLASIWEACRELLTENELAVVQTNSPSENGITVVTTLMHSSGQWINGSIYLPSDRSGGPQGYGSAMTYARRYALAAMVGIYQDDDDAQTAQNAQPKPLTKKYENMGAEISRVVEDGAPLEETLDSYRKAFGQRNQAECDKIYKTFKESVNG
jgi:hypothetical protein